jgi:hypothetical protein
MNSTQLQTTLASLVTFLAGLAAGRGLFGWDQATWITVITAVVGVGGAVWAAVTTKKSALVTSVAQMPEVASVKLESTAAGQSLAASTPSNVQVGG